MTSGHQEPACERSPFSIGGYLAPQLVREGTPRQHPPSEALGGPQHAICCHRRWRARLSSAESVVPHERNGYRCHAKRTGRPRSGWSPGSASPELLLWCGLGALVHHGQIDHMVRLDPALRVRKRAGHVLSCQDTEDDLAGARIPSTVAVVALDRRQLPARWHRLRYAVAARLHRLRRALSMLELSRDGPREGECFVPTRQEQSAFSR